MRALDIRLSLLPDAQLGEGTACVHNSIRSRVPYQGNDHLWGPEIDEIHMIIRELDL